MTIALILLAILATADIVVFGVLLGVVGWQYQRVRRDAAVRGVELPLAVGQFVFLAIMLIGGAAALLGAAYGLREVW